MNICFPIYTQIQKCKKSLIKYSYGSYKEAGLLVNVYILLKGILKDRAFYQYVFVVNVVWNRMEAMVDILEGVLVPLNCVGTESALENRL